MEELIRQHPESVAGVLSKYGVAKDATPRMIVDLMIVAEKDGYADVVAQDLADALISKGFTGFDGFDEFLKPKKTSTGKTTTAQTNRTGLKDALKNVVVAAAPAVYNEVVKSLTPPTTTPNAPAPNSGPDQEPSGIKTFLTKEGWFGLKNWQLIGIAVTLLAIAIAVYMYNRKK